MRPGERLELWWADAWWGCTYVSSLNVRGGAAPVEVEEVVEEEEEEDVAEGAECGAHIDEDYGPPGAIYKSDPAYEAVERAFAEKEARKADKEMHQEDLKALEMGGEGAVLATFMRDEVLHSLVDVPKTDERIVELRPASMLGAHATHGGLL
eukprot:gene3222-459_t